MRFLRGVLALLSRANKPLPGWLTLTLLLGTAAVASAPVFHGSISVPAGGSLTTASGVAPSFGAVPSWTGALPASQGGTGNTSIPTTNCLGFSGTTFTSNTCLANGSSVSFSQATVDTGTASNSKINLTNANGGLSLLTLDANTAGGSTINIETDASPAALTGIGQIYYKDTAQANSSMSKLYSGMGGSTSGNLGGYLIMMTKPDGGTSMNENVIADANGHVHMPGDNFAQQITTPASCTTLVVCGTTTFTFTPGGFKDPSGNAENPNCSNASVLDMTTAADVWLVTPQAITSTTITYQYVSIGGTSGAKTLRLMFRCYDSSY